MSRRRGSSPSYARWCAAASFAAAVTLAIAACTDLGGLSGGEDPAPPEGGSPDVLVQEAATQDASTADATEEAAVRDDSSVQVDAAGCVSCDCDKDLAAVDDAGCAAADAGVDCDDLDPLIHPGQKLFVSEPWTSSHAPAGDWDCNGQTVKQFATNVACTGFSCQGLAGFSGDPACGTTGAYVTCKGGLPSPCSVATMEMKTQACR